MFHEGLLRKFNGTWADRKIQEKMDRLYRREVMKNGNQKMKNRRLTQTVECFLFGKQTHFGTS